jgi:hypothetical protein
MEEKGVVDINRKMVTPITTFPVIADISTIN